MVLGVLDSIITQRRVDALVESLEQSRNLSRCIVHVDMDMFYAAVEMRDDPSLREKPMAVGGIGMLSTSNYAARKFGVRAAMPGYIALKLCPDLVIVPSRFDAYRIASDQVKQVLAEYDPNFQQVGFDEAYVDLTAWVARGADVQRVVAEMREKIRAATQLTASAGIAPNKMLAKICSDMNKPNGQYFLESTREAVLRFIHGLSVRKVSGIGKVSAAVLHRLGVQTCHHLYQQRRWGLAAQAWREVLGLAVALDGSRSAENALSVRSTNLKR
eukprot:m.1534700 g.1534700  ORF g.1534700 m.1534700 type:complete len:272 (+) comp25243_c0_seq52:3581-4396(+)